MGDDRSGDAVRHAIWVPVPRDEAFQAFTAGITAWWPMEHTFGRDEVRSIVIEPRQGGRWLERDAGGRERVWGQVMAWEPSDRVVLTAQCSRDGQPEPDPAQSGTIEVRFTPEGDGTRINLEHRDFMRHGTEGTENWHAGMALSEVWPEVLSRFVEAVT